MPWPGLRLKLALALQNSVTKANSAHRAKKTTKQHLRRVIKARRILETKLFHSFFLFFWWGASASLEITNFNWQLRSLS